MCLGRVDGGAISRSGHRDHRRGAVQVRSGEIDAEIGTRFAIKTHDHRGLGRQRHTAVERKNVLVEVTGPGHRLHIIDGDAAGRDPMRSVGFAVLDMQGEWIAYPRRYLNCRRVDIRGTGGTHVLLRPKDIDGGGSSASRLCNHHGRTQSGMAQGLMDGGDRRGMRQRVQRKARNRQTASGENRAPEGDNNEAIRHNESQGLLQERPHACFCRSEH